ncbi:hypothetical protein, variant 2 [Verruconis gallopava]|uniref:non-specific serine/threonine protein kinase n=1 Tax=Verruconis gallopava TaxID=253628 RepID=A0A0D2AIH8_9PEZI|nr:uncharacterized protein PV09_02393 [Verruconis gallopava]XP_016216558.1 hypothetical protein, variant 1 [Verruconis gallopava]XP_016216559.1 hypothetical protein, variant 2 [Verruconis gallopava]KIW06688.1 hypothetical protein PV09_02393 [Verruconis gallopava]KIW06689.1 hypothetical protein, variant 1 [Verruconis gallopava]KIW06690.1 hypothetical protein, variant 2 [Verruconis gallopava]
MSSAAPTAPVARSNSQRVPQPSDTVHRPHRSQSTRVPGSTSPRAHHTQRPSGSAAPQAADNVAQRDYESSQTQPPSSSGRGSSRDHDRSQYPTRTDSMRNSVNNNNNNQAQQPPRTSSSRGAGGNQDRYASMDAAARSQPPTNGMVNDGSMRHAPTAGRRRTTLDTQTGRWGLGKTIGAGSMGKVKLARNLETGEQVAIKIVPRQSTDEHRSQADRERAEHSKEIRTAREAAIVSLVNHPYICGMRDVVRTSHHWYMLFEYVNGGQMLDYIISHGRLKEKQARKFARQICSALDYCHRNSIVHRDLKIENILISKTGDIKIIDFGLSNLFSPHSTLKTFCGSLYFAAPELLQAKQYTGPEVDVWSFGIVLYVLVCGKVPFDDQSMPQLHAKIKKGYVEYPPWLSAECKNLISRMLVTDPKSRASLGEIANHPWMTKGFSGPPENFLPHREPIQLPLDQDVIKRMTGFDFGSPEYINMQLTKIINSEDYQRAVRNANRKQQNPGSAPDPERKRGVFDFYKRRNSASRDTLTNLSNEAVQYGDDPVNAYAPMLSIYYLVREKMERERREMNPGALETPSDKPLKLPDLPAPPESAYTNYNAYESPGEAPTGGRTRPRARTHGEDEVAEQMEKLKLQQADAPPAIVAPAETPARKESTAAGLFRRFSTRKRQPQGQTNEHANSAHAGPTLNVSSPTDTLQGTPRKSFSVRRPRPGETKENTPSSASLHVTGSQRHQPELLTPPSGGDGIKRFMSLRRSTSVDRRRLGKRNASEVGNNATEPPPTSGSDNSSYGGKKPAAVSGAGDAAGMGEDAQAPASVTVSRSAGTSRAKSLGHARRESIQARRMKRAQQNQENQLNVPEETEAEVARAEAYQDTDPEPTVQPVILKGLFSVSTTSSKPLSFIQKDLVRVLQQRGLEYEEIKGGFLCTHNPSLDRAAGGTQKHNMPDNPLPVPEKGQENLSPPLSANLSVETPQNSPGVPSKERTHRRKISFNALMGNSTEKDREEFLRAQQAQKSPRSPGDVLDSEAPSAVDDGTDLSDEDRLNGGRYRGPKVSAYGRARNPGETSTHVRDDVGENMVLKFEIFIVKIPIIGLYGIQFKKVAGNMMHYKNMAQEILKNLRL